MEMTEKKLKANQENSKKGGVKSDDGKAITRLNAVKHGILANCMTKYDQVQIDEIYQQLAEEFDDTRFSRKILIEHIAICYLRLLRCARNEADLIKQALNPPEYEPLFDIDDLGGKLIAKNDQASLNLQNISSLEIIYSRYEPELLNRIIKLIRILNQE